MSEESSKKFRSTEDIVKLRKSPNLQRTVFKNYLNQSLAKQKQLSGLAYFTRFLPANSWDWVTKYLKYTFSPKARFRDYTNQSESGVYAIVPQAKSDTLTLSILGDWGSGTKESYEIAQAVAAQKPDFTIHLGDVYYVGDTEEIKKNCLGQSSADLTGITWPKGTQGSFALIGNHEMYANGVGYFETFLPTLGINGQAQKASFFALETPHWRIIALDTGYNSVGVPILSFVPFLKRIPAISGNGELEKALLDWLENTVKPLENPKSTIILSHHNYFSAFPEDIYTRPAEQIAHLFPNQDLIWLWGHEHRLAIYDRLKTEEGLSVYGRCLGHGGMPVELAEPDPTKAPLQYYDARYRKIINGTKIGKNGFVNASISGETLTLTYVDIDGDILHRETFCAGKSGALTHSSKDFGILKRIYS